MDPDCVLALCGLSIVWLCTELRGIHTYGPALQSSVARLHRLSRLIDPFVQRWCKFRGRLRIGDGLLVHLHTTRTCPCLATLLSMDGASATSVQTATFFRTGVLLARR